MENELYKVSQIRELKRIDQWAKQICYWRTHLDVFIENYFQIKLKDVQKIQARCFGNCESLDIVENRGMGKTWLVAICSFAMAVLYPGSKIVIASSTAYQASLVLRKIDEYFITNDNVLREIDCGGHAPVQINNVRGVCKLKNGSRIESMAITSLRGTRAKIVVIDEAPEVKKDDLEAIIRPLRNETRTLCVQLGLRDYNSKLISITSACLKSNYFYSVFVEALRAMSKGDETTFACALDYHAAIRAGISTEEFFENEKANMPESKFEMEYGSMFIGEEMGSIFPYDMTERCRKLTTVEAAMPIKSTASYVIGVDLATSGSKNADNAVMVVIKLVELENEYYLKKLVYIRSYHGKRLDYQADELRRLLVKFPNTIKVVFDHRGLGDAFPEFLSQPWIDPETNKEYPPLVMDTERTFIHGAVPLLNPCVADNAVNQQMITALTIAFQHESIELPVQSKTIMLNAGIRMDSEDEGDAPEVKRYTQQEKAIFIEADALQIELGNIVARQSGAGNVLYDVARSTQHKDRYSALAMAVRYISTLEDVRRKKLLRKDDDSCIGVVSFLGQR